MDVLNKWLIKFSGPNFAEHYQKNKLLSDRVDMLASLLLEEDENIDAALNSKYYFAMTNVYKIATAMFLRGRSFILPLPMMHDLIKRNMTFFNDKEALEYVKIYETSVCSKHITIKKQTKKKNNH